MTPPAPQATMYFLIDVLTGEPVLPDAVETIDAARYARDGLDEPRGVVVAWRDAQGHFRPIPEE